MFVSILYHNYMVFASFSLGGLAENCCVPLPIAMVVRLVQQVPLPHMGISMRLGHHYLCAQVSHESS